VVNNVEELISTVYPDIFKLSNKSYQWLCERAIISPITAGEINDIILLKFDGHSREYLSIDTVTSTDDAIHYPQEFHVIRIIRIIRGIFSNWGPESYYDINFNRR